jgi:peroxiredoxin
MNIGLILLSALTSLAIIVGAFLGWQLLRQNGRLLLRVEASEQRLDELESGEAGDEHLSELRGRARHSVRAEPEHVNNGAQGTDAPYPDDRASRFHNRSFARSKLKRDGLKAGTPAPDFRLPRLDGRGELALDELRGRRVLLVFSDPHCGPCNALVPELEKFHSQNKQNVRPPSSLPPGEGEPSPAVEVVMISRGEPKENRAKVKEHGLTFPVVLQRQWEISRRYAMFATPVAYLIDEQGVITHDVAVGVDAILELLENEIRTCSSGLESDEAPLSCWTERSINVEL